MRPDDLLPEARRAARHLGVRDLAMYVVDLEQLRLVPVGARGEAAAPLAIDATLAGRAFQQLEILRADGPDGMTVWAPLIDGAERLGILRYELDRGSDFEQMRGALVRFTTLVAELALAKNGYGLALETPRRWHPPRLSAELLRSLLPPGTFGTDRVIVSGLVEPCYAVAGDAFDYAIQGDRLWLSIFDAMGHALEATFVASLALSSLRNARHEADDPLELIRAGDEAVAEAFGGDVFATAVVGQLDASTGRFRWANAGHPKPLLVRGGRVVARLETEPFLPLGLGAQEPAAQARGRVGEIQLEPRDRLLLVTDGIVEARAPDGTFFGEQRLVDLIELATAAGYPAPETMRRLRQSILDHQAGQLQDDATLLFVEWIGSRREGRGQAERLRLTEHSGPVDGGGAR